MSLTVSLESTYLLLRREFREAKKSDCEGLEVAVVWVKHIIDRIMGEDKWHKDH